MQDAFGVDREEISKVVTPKGARALWGATEAAGARLRVVPAGRSSAAVRGRTEPRPRPAAKAPTQRVVSDLFAERGNQVANDAARAVRGRASRKRKLKTIAGVAGVSAAASAPVLTYDAIARKKNGRVSVSA